MYIYDTEQRMVIGTREIRTNPCQNLIDLKKLFQDYIPLKTDDIHLVLVNKHTSLDSLEYISNTELPLSKIGFSTGSFCKVNIIINYNFRQYESSYEQLISYLIMFLFR